MIEDDDKLKLDGSTSRDMLLYDYFKHLTSLVLIALGGLLIIVQDLDPTDVKPRNVIIVIVLLAAAGILSFGGAGEIARAHYTGTPTKRSVEYARILSPALLALGLGYFLAMFVDSLT